MRRCRRWMSVLVKVSELNSNAIRLQIITEEIALTVRDARTDTFDRSMLLSPDLDTIRRDNSERS